MNIGIIGAGNLGSGLAKRLAAKGHAVMLSFSKETEKLRRTADSMGAAAGTPAEAVDFADVAVLASPWAATPEALRQVGTVAKTKVLWDCTNALKPDMSGLAVGTTTSGAEEIARLAPWANVVKAIPPFAEVLHSTNPLIGGLRSGVFVCGDNPEAREVVARLVEDIGAAPVIAGPLLLARYTEPAAMLLVHLAYLQGFGARIGLILTHETKESARPAA
jgi:predicted dinucleotide-binding enzyme